ncbi:MAG: phytanoyl-CoA dioxygenase family protein [Chitinophaga sp.]|uniref:phytanoyl-CoA dioxygenase family protein n=1 Tax=Chitinophaga sp. TaxID=1869181 RepID=UPI0025C32F5C|nr:phytanoyl-CoA dioxygenase family protein [Chitinophaga sp.]MBV8252746.1 phytanoyl-CoA dioxygenase family protein [Chitinophaga sp.]
MKTNHQPVFRLEKTVTNEHLAWFQQHGFIQFKNFIDQDTLHQLLEAVNQVQRLLLRNDIQKINGVPLKFGTDIDGSPLIQRIAFASQYSNVLREFLRDPRLQSLISLLGPYDGRIGENEKDGLVVNHYVNSDHSQFRQLGWHTDSPRDLFLGSRIMPMLNVGLHLDNCPIDNGGLRVLPGTHKQSLFRLLFRKKYFIDHHPDKKEVGFNIQAGDLTIHDGRLWHRVQQSPNNGEASRRRVMYIPIITGAYQPKHTASPTPFYHKLASLYGGKPQWAAVKTPQEELIKSSN